MNENAKNPAFEVPAKLPGVKPEEYSKSIPTGRGSAAEQAANKKPHGSASDDSLPTLI